MDEISVFFNLKHDDESTLRLAALTGNPPNSAVHTPPLFGEGKFSNQHYRNLVTELHDDNNNIQCFFAPCWPSLQAMHQLYPLIPIFFSGLVAKSTYQFPDNSTGIKAFDIDILCPYWLSLLLQVANVSPSEITLGVIHDNSHQGPTSQFNTIRTAAITKGVSQNNIKKILANSSTDSDEDHIKSKIESFADDAGAGSFLIVTACTMTGIERDIITKTARDRSLITIYSDEMYISRTPCGGLMSYGPSVLDLYSKLAVDYLPQLPQVLAGNLPPSSTNKEFKLTINRAVRNELSLNFPETKKFTIFDPATGETMDVPATYVDGNPICP